jgi:hypothetical protein
VLRGEEAAAWRLHRGDTRALLGVIEGLTDTEGDS